MKTLRLLLVLITGLLAAIQCGHAQIMPQDGWRWDRKKILGDFKAMTLAPNGKIYAASANQIHVLAKDLTELSTFSGPSGTIQGMASDSLTNIYVLANQTIYAYNQNGGFIRQFGGIGNEDGLLNAPSGSVIAIDSFNRIYVADGGNNRIQVFNGDAQLLTQWGKGIPAGLDGSMANVSSVNILPTGHVATYTETTRDYQIFTSDGVFIRKINNIYSLTLRNLSVTRDGLILGITDSTITVHTPNLDSHYLLSASLLNVSGLGNFRSKPIFDSTGRMWLILDTGIYSMFRNYSQFTFRNVADDQTIPAKSIPFPKLIQVSQRSEYPLVDIDFAVEDADSPYIQVSMLAFTNGSSIFTNQANSLSNLVRMNSFVEGTATNLGLMISANVTNRVTWDVSADWNVGFGNIQFEVLAKDERGLLPFHFITVPETNSNPAIKVSSRGFNERDFLSLWFWLIATNCNSITFSNGAIYGVGGAYNSLQLAYGGITTTNGRSYLLNMMGLRELTPSEINQMNSGRFGFPATVTGERVVKP